MPRVRASAPRCAALAVRGVETRVGGRAGPARRVPAPERDARLQHRGGPGRPPRGHGRLGVEAAVVEGFPARAWHTAPGPGGGRGRPRGPTTAWCRDAQDGRTGRDPLLAPPGQRPVRPGDRPSVPALTLTDGEQQTSALAIGPLQRGPLLQPETPSGDRGEAQAVARPSHAVETPATRFETADHRPFVLAWRSHTTPGGPVAVAGRLDDAREAAPRARARTAGVRLDLRDVEDVWAECCRTEHVW